MMSITIRKAIEIKAPAAHVWRFVGNEAGLRRWWGFRLTLEAKQGGRCEERSWFNGKHLCLTGEVTVYAPPHQLTLVLHQTGESDAWPVYTTISLTLTEENGSTVVTLEHQAMGLVSVEDATGWGMPEIQMPTPERQTILNQLPAHTSRVVKPFVQQPQQIGARTWLPAYDAHWNNSLEKLRQIISQNLRKETKSETELTEFTELTE